MLQWKEDVAKRRKRMGEVHYSIHIHWSDEDKLFIATLPDFPTCEIAFLGGQESSSKDWLKARPM